MAPPRPASGSLPPPVAEAGGRSRVCWLAPVGGLPGGAAARLVWHAWYDGGLVVLSGDDQPLPEELVRGPVIVVLRARTGDVRSATWDGEVEVVAPEDPRWPAHARALLAVRLNLPDPEAALERWRRTAKVLRITTLRG